MNTFCLFVWLINMVLFPEVGKYMNMCKLQSAKSTY
jgi:hypothetical protein